MKWVMCKTKDDNLPMVISSCFMRCSLKLMSLMTFLCHKQFWTKTPDPETLFFLVLYINLKQN